jgi:hypothetical protein
MDILLAFVFTNRFVLTVELKSELEAYLAGFWAKFIDKNKLSFALGC